MKQEKIDVFIVHGNPLFCVGLSSVLERHEGISIVGQTTERDQIVELVAASRPDVVLFDGALTSCLPAYSAVEMVTLMRKAGARGIIVFAPSRNEEDLFQFMLAGASAYELPTLSADSLIEKIHRVAEGEYLISSEIFLSEPSVPHQQKDRIEEIRLPCKPDTCRPVKRLYDPTQISEREITILSEIVKGCSNKQIAHNFKISDQTVKNHITSILKKLQVHDRTAAVVVALRRGLISFPEPSEKDVVLALHRFVKPARLTTRRNLSRSYAPAANE